MPIEAKIICDSISPESQRLTTFQLRYPRFIHAEFMTHRQFSRNASSSRAIPTAKLLAECRTPELMAMPAKWVKNEPGMQGYTELDDRQDVEYLWNKAARWAAVAAENLMEAGVHKQIANRLLEPFTHINVVASATDNGWMNFFGLRLDKAAEPTMQALAVAMFAAYAASDPKPLKLGEWHLPYIDDEDREALGQATSEVWHDIIGTPFQQEYGLVTTLAIRVSVARCARTSYKSFETGNRSTVEEDLKLYEKLVGAQPLHASPAEHQATPDELVRPIRFNRYMDDYEFHNSFEWGNFTGWRQYRKMLPGEAVAPLPEAYCLG